MDKIEFVEAVKEVVRDPIFKNLLSDAERPAGRSIPPEVLERAQWLRSLSAPDRKHLDAFIRNAVDDAIFGVFCVLDGVRAIENGPEKGKLELYFVKDGEKQLLNSEDDEYLHDLYNE